MDSRPTTIERAFALARTGDFENVSAIRAKLKAEGYLLAQLEGPSLIRQLRAICSASRGVADA